VKKILIGLVMAGVVSFVASSSAAASHTAIVKIPFQFIAGQRLLPAGSYRITPQAPENGVVTISRVGDNALTVFVVTDNLGYSDASGLQSKVTFVKYDGQLFLRTVAVPGTDGRVVAFTKAAAERTLASLNLLNAQPAANAAK
jgi:hypothetical protein